MDFNWFFRRKGPTDFHDHDIFSGLHGHDVKDNIKDEPTHSFSFPFMGSFDGMNNSNEIFKHMDDMFSQMFTSSFTPFESIQFDGNPSSSDPRSMMLKDPDCKKCEQHSAMDLLEPVKPSQLVDNDIDDEVAQKGLIFDGNALKSNFPETFCYKKFSSVKTVRLPGGVLEEHQTFTDSQGNVTTTIRRSIGDQQHESITHVDGSGMREKEENLINLDENDLSEFERRWHSLKTRKNIHYQPHSETIIPHTGHNDGDPSYLSLFKKFFGF